MKGNASYQKDMLLPTKHSSKCGVKEGCSTALGVCSEQNHCFFYIFTSPGASLWSTSYPLLHWGEDVPNRSSYLWDLARVYGWLPWNWEANGYLCKPPLQDYTVVWTLEATGGLPASHGFIFAAPSGGYGSLKDMISYRTDCSNVQPQWN